MQTMSRPTAIPPRALGARRPATVTRLGGSAGSSESLSAALLALRPSAIWHAFWTSPWSFRLTCLYVFFEYVRPQQIYPILQGPRWALMSLAAATLAYLTEGMRIQSRTMINWLLAAFALIVVMSSVLATFPSASYASFNVFANWVIAFFLIANTASTERRWFVFIVLYMLWCLKMSQHGFMVWAMRGFTFASWGVGGAPGWFQNSGEFALQMGMFSSMSVHLLLALRRHLRKHLWMLLWLVPVTAVGSVIASSSRGGQLALAVIGVLAVLRSPARTRTRTLLAMALVMPLAWMALPETQKSRFRTSGEDATSQLRLLYWERGLDMVKTHPVLGIGYANWVPYYRTNYYSPADTLNPMIDVGVPKIEVAHNSFVEVGAELGVTGLVCFLALIVGGLAVNAKSRRLLVRAGAKAHPFYLLSVGLDDAIVVFCIAGFFMSVAFYPFIWIHLGLGASLYVVAFRIATTRASSGIVRT